MKTPDEGPSRESQRENSALTRCYERLRLEALSKSPDSPALHPRGWGLLSGRGMTCWMKVCQGLPLSDEDTVPRVATPWAVASPPVLPVDTPGAALPPDVRGEITNLLTGMVICHLSRKSA